MSTISNIDNHGSITDLGDYPLTTTSAAARHYRHGVELLLALQPGAGQSFAAAVEIDPSFALGHASLAVTQGFYGHPGNPVDSVGLAMTLAGSATRRERQHVQALATTLSGDVVGAGSLAAEHLAEFPRDHLIAYLVVMSSHWYGDAAARQASQRLVEAAARHAADDDWAFHAIHAFVLEERNELERAEQQARRSLALRPDSGEAAHVLAHVLYEQGRHAEGFQFVDDWTAAHYRVTGPNWVHIQWHAALFELELGRADDALVRYHRHISPATAGPVALTDAAALLWRLWLDGHPDVPVDDLAEPASEAARKAGWTFADWHTGIALALTGQLDTAAELVAQLDVLADAGHPSAVLARHVTRAAVALSSGDPQRAVTHLGIALDRRDDLGGSHAQLDVLDQTLVHARWRSGDVDGARAAVEERARWAESPRERRLLEMLNNELNLAPR